MTAAVTATVKFQATVQETLGSGVNAATAPTIVHQAWDFAHTLNATSTPPATKHASFQQALAAGVATIDLTALTGTNGATVTFSGLKVQVARFRNPSTNANNITITFGASNGYLLGGTAFKWILEPGQELMVFCNDASPDVDGTHKTIDLSGTLVQALDVTLVAG